ncbi:SRP40, C-terminal domain-containing protein, partial [Earliella scabrosa]
TPAPNGNERNKGANGEGKKPRKVNAPFQRIKPGQVSYVDERLKDNSFESRGASTNDYGARAARDLIVTRGAGFRKEKNKKKRGSYRGGEITMQSHSIKFTD